MKRLTVNTSADLFSDIAEAAARENISLSAWLEAAAIAKLKEDKRRLAIEDLLTLADETKVDPAYVDNLNAERKR